jgi:hypothetical protein
MTYYGDHAPQLAASVISLATLAYIVFGLRVYTRTRIGAWGVDDWCMVAAIVSLVALLPSWIQCAHISASLHSADHLMHWWCIRRSRHSSGSVEPGGTGQRNAGTLASMLLSLSVDANPTVLLLL